MDWPEIDLEARTWTFPAERAKNDEAHIIPLTDMAVAELAALYPQERSFVFSTTGTTPVSGYSKAKRLLDERMLKVMQHRQKERGGDPRSVKFDDWRLHDLRHWSATVSIGQGHDVRTVAGRLGHANPAMTLRVYAHVFAAADQAVAAGLGDILKQPGS